MHVTAEPELLRARMLDRAAGRHPVHWDGEAADEVAGRAAADEWQPLPLDGDLLEVDTTSWPDLDDGDRERRGATRLPRLSLVSVHRGALRAG